MDVSNVPGFPFHVPPPFPSLQLKTFIPATINNGISTHKMIDARSVPQSYHRREPLVGLGFTWHPVARMWTMSGEDRAHHKLMVDNFHYHSKFHYKVDKESLLSDYISAAQSLQSKDVSHREMKNTGVSEKLSAMSLKNEDLSIITIGEWDESDDETINSCDTKQNPVLW